MVNTSTNSNLARRTDRRFDTTPFGHTERIEPRDRVTRRTVANVASGLQFGSTGRNHEFKTPLAFFLRHQLMVHESTHRRNIS